MRAHTTHTHTHTHTPGPGRAASCRRASSRPWAVRQPPRPARARAADRTMTYPALAAAKTPRGRPVCANECKSGGVCRVNTPDLFVECLSAHAVCAQTHAPTSPGPQTAARQCRPSSRPGTTRPCTAGRPRRGVRATCCTGRRRLHACSAIGGALVRSTNVEDIKRAHAVAQPAARARTCVHAACAPPYHERSVSTTYSTSKHWCAGSVAAAYTRCMTPPQFGTPGALPNATTCGRRGGVLS